MAAFAGGQVSASLTPVVPAAGVTGATRTHGGAVERNRVLIAPVTITPTKPLTVSHLKALLWLDAMYKATSRVADVTLRYSHTTYNVTAQTLGFWEYVDRTVGDTDFHRYSDEDIGELYVQYQAQPAPAAFERLRPYARAVEDIGWLHPVSERVLRLWVDQYRDLGLYDPGLLAFQPPGMGLEDLVALLSERDLCIDTRRDGGPVYLDTTAYGQPIRKIVSAGGQPNYLACALRELVPLVAGRHEVVLCHDPELTADYIILATVLQALGARTHRLSLGRVPIDGVVRSTRAGGWHGHTVASLLAAHQHEDDRTALRLGLRLYFIGTLGKGQDQSFRHNLLEQAIRRAGRLLATPGGADEAQTVRFIRQHGGRHGYVDPYQLTSVLLSRRRHGPLSDVARQVLT
jgi:hypothetical protein